MCYNTKKELWMKKRLVLISGVSGAGKTTASNFLEDMGYICMDQFPPELLENLVTLMENETSLKYDHIAITISLLDLEKYRHILDNMNIDSTLILLDASEETIINRYKFTRRVHPLLVSNKVNTLNEAVAYEKELLEEFKKLNATIIDTTSLTNKAHKEILDRIINYDERLNFSISFVSFGFKNGIPNDADLVFDVRFLDNPFYEKDLKNKTGNDLEVYNYVMEKPRTKEFVQRLLSYLDFTFDSYDNEEKRHLTVCVGCTGGQHRSVSITNYLYDYYKDKYLCNKAHRELKESV